MKINGVYILSRRSIARMIATITAALMTLCAAVTAQAEATVRRIYDATSSLISLDRQMIGKLTRTVVPEIIYREYKSLYLELRTARCSPAAPPMARGAAPPRDVRVLRGEVFGALGGEEELRWLAKGFTNVSPSASRNSAAANGKYFSSAICGEAAFETRFQSQSMWLKYAEHKA